MSMAAAIVGHEIMEVSRGARRIPARVILGLCIDQTNEYGLRILEDTPPETAEQGGLRQVARSEVTARGKQSKGQRIQFTPHPQYAVRPPLNPRVLTAASEWARNAEPRIWFSPSMAPVQRGSDTLITEVIPLLPETGGLALNFALAAFRLARAEQLRLSGAQPPRQ